MGSNDGVTVYEAAQKCDCSPKTESSSAVDIAANLLLGNRDSTKLRLVSPEEFKPWHNSRTLIPMRFKFHPPDVSQTSIPNSDPVLPNDRLGLSPDSDHLLEFSPVYSEKSCLKYQLKGHNQNGFDKGNDMQRTCKDSNKKCNLPREELNPLAKSLWCASPLRVNCKKRKEKELRLEKLKDVVLNQVKELHQLKYHQRGKWILRAEDNSGKGKNLRLEQLWKKVCTLIKEGHLPYCNTKLQRMQDEVLVYCDFGHSLKIRSTLEKALGLNVGTCRFYVHPVGVVMEL